VYRRRILVLMVAAVSISACSKDDGIDFCKHHNTFHSDHLDSVAELTIEISDDGVIAGNLSIPETGFGEIDESDLRSLLSDSTSIFTLESEEPCAVSVTSIGVSATGLEADFAAGCGADNKLGRINVSLFENIGGVQEVVTSVTTSATSKRFAISRQCDNPIFRLE